jgi:hypothetical protein
MAKRGIQTDMQIDRQKEFRMEGELERKKSRF